MVDDVLPVLTNLSESVESLQWHFLRSGEKIYDVYEDVVWDTQEWGNISVFEMGIEQRGIDRIIIWTGATVCSQAFGVGPSIDGEHLQSISGRDLALKLTHPLE